MRYVGDDAEFYGVEVSSEFDLMSFAGGQLVLGVFGDTIRGKLKDGGDVPRLPPYRVGARLAWDSPSSELWARVVDAGAQDRPGNNEEPTRGYTRWDLGADFEVALQQTTLTLFVELKNVTDEEIRLSTSFLREVAPEAGRSVELGMRWMF